MVNRDEYQEELRQAFDEFQQAPSYKITAGA